VHRRPNGRWVIRAPTGDPVGPRVAVLPRPSRRELLAVGYGMRGCADRQPYISVNAF